MTPIKTYGKKPPTNAQLVNLVIEVTNGIPRKDVHITDSNIWEDSENGVATFTVLEIRFTDLSDGSRFRMVSTSEGSYRLGKII